MAVSINPGTFSAIVALAAFPFPLQLANQNALGAIDRLERNRVLCVHGTEDWMFPICHTRDQEDAMDRLGLPYFHTVEVDGWTHSSPVEVIPNVVTPWLQTVAPARPAAAGGAGRRRFDPDQPLFLNDHL